MFELPLAESWGMRSDQDGFIECDTPLAFSPRDADT